MDQTKVRIGPLQITIIILTVATALVHLSLVFPVFDPIFFGNFVGYLALVAALYLPIPQLAGYRTYIRWALIAFAAVTILGWIFIGDKTLLIGYPDKVIEIALIALLILDSRQS